MDYRNADGSIAEMCGNGVRVFARHLVDEGLVEPETSTILIGTRAGLREAELLDDGRVRVWMGRPELTAGTHPTVAMDETDWTAYQVNVGNPHAVIPLGQEHDLLARTSPARRRSGRHRRGQRRVRRAGERAARAHARVGTRGR